MGRGLVNGVSVEISGWHWAVLVSFLLYDELKRNSRQKTKSDALPPPPDITDKGKEVEAALFCWTHIITLFFMGLPVSPVIECWFTVHCCIWSSIYFTCTSTARSRNSVAGIVTRQWAGQPSKRCSMPGRNNRIFSSPKHPGGRCFHQASYWLGSEDSFQGDKAAGA